VIQPADGAYVCHGVTWATGDPRLLLAPLPAGPLVHAHVMNRRFGFRTGTGRWCTGRYGFTDTVRVEALACPGRARVEHGGQCDRCAGQDEFRLAHQFHQGGASTPEALGRYMAQPHWLYLATFADSTTKVGTAAEPRRRSRLDEQGALFATYLAKSPDGRAVRYLEDALGQRLELPQSVRAAAKLQALARLRDLSSARTAHEQYVVRAAGVLADLETPVVLEAWTPPEVGDRLRTGSAERVLYPHDLREGEHGFTVRSCIGSQGLVVLGEDNDEPGYLLDLGALKGRHITLGTFASPDTAVQTSLF